MKATRVKHRSGLAIGPILIPQEHVLKIVIKKFIANLILLEAEDDWFFVGGQ